MRVTAHPFKVRGGRLSNLSVSGGFIRAGVDWRLLTRVVVSIAMPQRAKHDAPDIPAYVARICEDGIGIEWCEFAPPDVNRLLQSVTTRRYVRPRKPGSAAGGMVPRLCPPLLKPGGT